MNEYDTAKILKILEGQYSAVNTEETADLIIINTCSIREKAESKLYSLLGEIAELKAKRPKLLLGVGGCVAQQEGEAIIKRNRAVDFVFGTHNMSLVPHLIARVKSGAGPQVAVNYRDEWEELPLGFTEQSNERGGNVTRFVAISRGCNKNCTYCIVPTTRGPEVSRNLDEILREVKIAAHTGTREIVLLGQTVNSYGVDLTPRVSFATLLNEVSAISGIERIRFTSPHPQEVRDDFVRLVAENPKICRHIHMPLQSGSDKILAAMNRNYRRARYLKIIEGLKNAVPDIAITTDIIVGFPGETEQDFLDTLDILEKVQFDSSYSFAYSPRPGTAAEGMQGQLPHEVKLERLARYQARQQEITATRLASWVGKTGEILIEGSTAHDSALFRGRLSQNILVNLSELPAAPIKIGDILPVSIVSAGRNTLRGVVPKN